MKRIITLLVMVFLLAACNQQSSEPKERIISLMPSNTEILYALGVGKQIVGVSSVDDYPEDVKKIKKFDAMNINYEAILKAKPTMVFTHESMAIAQEKTMKKLAKKGIKVIVVSDTKSIDTIGKSINQIAKAVHKEEAGKDLTKKINQDVKTVVDKYKAKTKDKSVFIEVSSNPSIYTGGSDTLFDSMLTKLSAKNTFHDIKGWQSVNQEAIIKKNPDVLITTSGISTKAYQKEISKRPGFESIKAVQDNHVVAVNDDLISRPGPRIAKGLEQVAKAIAEK